MPETPKYYNQKESEEVIAGLQKGSAEAFQILYNKYHNRVYNYCLKILVDVDLAADAYQETFIKVYENSKTFVGTNFQAWLFTIARRVCINYLRNRKEFVEYEEIEHTIFEKNDSDFLLKDRILKTINKLPLRYKEPLILREYQEFTYPEIAQILEIDLNTAKTNVHRARLILRKLLEPLLKEYNES